MGIILVLLTLKQAPDAMHHLSKMDSRSTKLSNSDRKPVVSSAKSVVINFLPLLGSQTLLGLNVVTYWPVVL
jgi:hypothetical protein